MESVVEAEQSSTTLCAKCRGIGEHFDEVFHQPRVRDIKRCYKHHPSYFELERAAKNGCKLCRVIIYKNPRLYKRASVQMDERLKDTQIYVYVIGGMNGSYNLFITQDDISLQRQLRVVFLIYSDASESVS
jgi:hypothetical protein